MHPAPCLAATASKSPASTLQRCSAVDSFCRSSRAATLDLQSMGHPQSFTCSTRRCITRSRLSAASVACMSVCTSALAQSDWLRHAWAASCFFSTGSHKTASSNAQSAATEYMPHARACCSDHCSSSLHCCNRAPQSSGTSRPFHNASATPASRHLKRH